jgi:hypothetical protein
VSLAPSDHEIMAHHGVAVWAAYQHVRALQRKGVFSSALHPRNIRLSPEHVPPAGLPIIGRVVAGAPMLTVKHLARDPELHRLWRCGRAHSSCVSREPAGWTRRPTGEMTGWCAPSHGLSTGRSARRGRCGGNGQDEPVLAHRPVAGARGSAAGISAAQASVSAAYIQYELSDRQGTVARTAEAARAAACTARETAEATNGGTDSRPT